MNILRQFFLWFLITAFAFPAISQTHLLVQPTTGNTQSYPLTEIRSIRFGPSSMTVNRINANPIIFNLSEINQYSFGSPNSINAFSLTSGKKLGIFPNPASDFVELLYENPVSEFIQIDLCDATGRLISEIFSGNHQGTQTYRQSLNLPAGLYFCRLSIDGSILSKPLMIQ